MTTKPIKFGAQSTVNRNRLPKWDKLKKGIEIQTYGMAENQFTVHAGVHFVPEITARYLYKLHRHWLRWRYWYDHLPENRTRDYPAKHDLCVAYFGAHPIDQPKSSLELKVLWIKV